MEITAAQLAALVGGKVDGDANIVINNYAKIEEGTEGCLTFLANPKYTHFVYTTKASAILVKNDFIPEEPVKATLIRVEDPYTTLAMLLNHLSEMMNPAKVGIEQPSFIAEGVNVPESTYVGAFAYISKGVTMGENVKIYPQAYIGDNVTLGDNVTIYPGAKIYHSCVIGNNCTIHAGTVIGSDGFGFAPSSAGEYSKIAQVGNVILEDNVEIGSNTTIDRATMGSTIIKRGVKLDNLIQIAHNVEVGENTVMAAQVGVAGSTKIGKNNMFGGQVGIAGHITIGDNNGIGAQSGIPNNVTSGNRLLGYPAVNAIDFARQLVYIKSIPSLKDEIKALKKEIAALKQEEK